MKQNKYDDAAFFSKYAQMPRSQYGLEAAGEWETLRRILPDFSGKRVLDLGCGYGWHCCYAVQQGAAEVIGVDLSENMLAVARDKCPFPQVRFLHMPMEEIGFPDASFDIVLSSLALHYVASFSDLVKRIQRCLTDGGWFVFSTEHPIFTAQGPQDWCYDEAGRIRHFPVDRYFDEGPRQAVFLGETVTKYHRTLTTLLQTLLANGFSLRQVVEPQPPAHLMDQAGMKDELRRPMMLLAAAQKV